MTEEKTIRAKPKKTGPYRKATWQEFVRFTAFPNILREKEFGFDTDSAFGKKHRVNPDTLCRWKNEQTFWDEVKKTWKRWGKDKTPDVILGLYRTAVKQGRAAEALAWMKIVEDWQEKLDVQDVYARKTLKDIQDNIRRLVERNKIKK